MSVVGIEEFAQNLSKFMRTKKFKNMSMEERLNFAYRAVSSGCTLENKS